MPPAVADAIERSASPGRVRPALQQLSERDSALVDRLAGDDRLRAAFVAVVAASRSLTQLCLTEPAAFDVLAGLDHRPVLDGDVVRWKRLEFLRIAARDLTGRDELEEVGAGLARMADEVFSATWDADGVAVIAMGKYGGSELNYASDVDVMFVGAGDVARALGVARRCFRVDADLRPEGRNGPLVRSLDAFRSYWERWARTWEFQALLKARPAAGSDAVGAAFAAAAADAVWGRPFGAEEVREVRAMKARAEGEMVRRGLADRELKRGRGGIRDIEFAIQLLQLVHGRADPSLRSPTTLVALAELAAAGYVSPSDADRLTLAYRFLRMVEHRLQLWDEGQVHAVPADGEALERLARVCGFRPSVRRDAVAAFLDELRRHQRAARTIHERLFFRPLLESFTGDVVGPGLSEAAAAERLAAFGFTDADRTREALQELTRGLTRRSRLMQQVLPLVLGWLSETPDPDAGLLGLRTLVAHPVQGEALVRTFRDAPDGWRRLCILLGSSRLVATGLQHAPQAVADLAVATRAAPDPRRAAEDGVAWRSDVEDRLAALRRFRQTQELEIWIRDLLGEASVDDVAASLTTLGEVVLDEALSVARAVTGVDVPMAVIAMGRFGGAELSYASDLDVMLVHGGSSASDAADAERLATELVRIVNGATPVDRLWTLDIGLRPEGKQGPLSRSLEGYEQYYARWAQVWERQALLRGRVAVGSSVVGDAFAELARAFLAREVTADDEREIRRMKARIERERIPPGDDPDFHLKLGRGGLADVEWTVQLLQLRHRVWGQQGTMDALEALTAAGHVSEADAGALAAAYRYCEHTRNRLFLVRGAPGDALPVRADQLGRLARSLGTTAAELREEYRRVARRAREVTERLFYGAEGTPRTRRWQN